MGNLNLKRVCFLVLALCTVSWATQVAHEQNVKAQCGFTVYQTLCVQTLTDNPSDDFLSALVKKTISETKPPVSNFAELSSHFIPQEAQLSRLAMDYCHELLTMSIKRLSQALEALKKSPRKQKKDIQTWLSAALTFQQTCKDEADIHAPSNLLMHEISTKMDYLSQLSSNSLSLVNRISGNSENRTMKRRRLLNFPSWVSASERKLLQSTEIKANAVVAKDGTGNYETISEAIKAAKGSRFVIHVKSGVYKEKISTSKDGITLIGDGKYSTIITGSSNVAGGSSLQETPTFSITGDGFIARDIGFENTAGPLGDQAVALLVASDHAVFYKCSIAGYQDTLYALSLRQFYRECDIYGTVDFIFGNAAAVFQSCNLVFRKPGRHGAYNVILANGRSNPGQNTGFSVQNCRITVSSDFSSVKGSYRSYLGRPWREYSRAIVMQSTIEDAVASRGWTEWEGASSSTYKTLYFAEYSNTGSGAGTSGRVKWPGFHVVGSLEAGKFTVANFIDGTSWLPSTGVTFISGL